jgi:hypothetical protein
MSLVVAAVLELSELTLQHLPARVPRELVVEFEDRRHLVPDDPRPTILWQIGLAGHAPARRIAAEFASPLYPGSELTVVSWPGGFEARSGGETVLRRGLLER